MDDWGNRFLSWNTIPARHEVLPDRWRWRRLDIPSAEVLKDLTPASDDGRVFPLAPAPRVSNAEASTHFNALAGLTIFRGRALGPSYLGNIFVGETLANVVHRRVIQAEGATFTSVRVEPGTEFLRSRDPWFHAVFMATGPDDNLYLADFHQEFVKHPDFVPKDMRDRVEWARGREQGRLSESIQLSWTPAFFRP